MNAPIPHTQIQQKAQEIGFHEVGIALIDKTDVSTVPHLQSWLKILVKKWRSSGSARGHPIFVKAYFVRWAKDLDLYNIWSKTCEFAHPTFYIYAKLGCSHLQWMINPKRQDIRQVMLDVRKKLS